MQDAESYTVVAHEQLGNSCASGSICIIYTLLKLTVICIVSPLQGSYVGPNSLISLFSGISPALPERQPAGKDVCIVLCTIGMLSLRNEVLGTVSRGLESAMWCRVL